MSFASSALLVCALAATAMGDPPATLLQNGGFEEGALGERPPGWVVPSECEAAGCKATIVEDQPHSGKRCARLEFPGGTASAPFGNVLQSIDAHDLRGKLFSVRAWVRADHTEAEVGRAQLWVRVDREGGKMGFFESTRDRPITEPTWKELEIRGSVVSDATELVVGLMLFGKGSASIDDVRLEIIGDRSASIAPPRALEGRGLDNLVAFVRLLGYVRWFHPSNEAAAADWDAFTIAAIPRVEGAMDPAGLARVLQEIFAPLAPSVRVFPTAQRPSDSPPMPEAAQPKIVAWEYHGMSTQPEGLYHRTLLREDAPQWKVPDGFADPRNPLEVELGGGVSCLVPTSLFADGDRTLPRPTAPAPPPRDSFATGDDRSTRLAAVALAWNVFQHFYAYFDVVKADWPAALRRALAAAATDADEFAFTDTLRRLVAELRDGHGFVGHAGTKGHALPPIVWEWIEDRVVVTRIGSGEESLARIRPGDVVESIDGRPVADALRDEERLTPGATDGIRRWRALATIAEGDAGSPLVLGIRPRTGEPFTATLKRATDPMAAEVPEKRPPSFAEVRPGIRYVNLDEATTEQFDHAVGDLAAAKGVVFDLRGYPSHIQPVFLQHLTDVPIQSARWMVPVVRRPDREGWTFDETGRWNLPPLAPRLRGKIAFVTDARAISYAESCLGIVEAYKLGEIVGGTTAGTNGDINPFTLPGKYTIFWTGMKVLKHDGSPHHGVGIRPTVPISRTIAGVAAGRDELLEKAIEVVSKD
jgi:C-terminal processing protease CtpA/Prc